MLHEINKHHGQFRNLRFVLQALGKDPGWGMDHLHCVHPGWVDCCNGPAIHTAEFDLPIGAYQVVKNTASLVILMKSENCCDFPAWRGRDEFGWITYLNGTFTDLDTKATTGHDPRAFASAIKQLNDILHPDYIDPDFVKRAFDGMTGFAKSANNVSVSLFGPGRMASIAPIAVKSGKVWTHRKD